MRKRMQALVPVLLLATLLASCGPVGTKTAIGGLGGAAAGGLIGAAAGGGGKGIAAGVILGGLLGGAVGNYLDQRDRQLQQQAEMKALESAPSGTTTAWKNPDSGNQGTVTPKRTYQTASGQYCREYQQTVTVGGKKQNAYGTACRQPDGSWKIAS
ncbi:MAG TPA: RT0821/Lpp0805 family surface protein [Candidatus Binatia bacterium]|nr:RT0821/Lpp0805 family surface protein [Candidatus Binatia bacterium]